MGYRVRKAEYDDRSTVLTLYENARKFMAAHGNASQWGKQDPAPSVIDRDIREENLYLLYDEKGIHGVFAFLIFEDPTYRVIEKGNWNWNCTYGVIHRVAGDGSGGILKSAVSYAEQLIPCLRIDTHEKNLPMQRAILREGFSYCGIIYTSKGDQRLAYDRFKEIDNHHES